MPCSRPQFSDHSALDNYFLCKKFTVQTLLWSLEFVIQIDLEHDNIAVWNLSRSWSISSYEIITKKINKSKTLQKSSWQFQAMRQSPVIIISLMKRHLCIFIYTSPILQRFGHCFIEGLCTSMCVKNIDYF